jgi:hypothetical protein
VAGEQIIVSYSELDTFRQCPLKHHLLYNMRWTKPVKEGSALQKGSLYHGCMEVMFKLVQQYQGEHRGKSPKEGSADEKMLIKNIWAAIMPMLADEKTGEQSEVQGLIQWMIEGFIEHYGLMPDWRVVGVEHQLLVPLRDQHGRRSRYILKAKLDLIIRDRRTGMLWVVDHKSGRDLPSQMDLEIDDQFGLYTWGMNEVGKPVIGSIHLGNRTQRNKSFMPLDTRMGMTYLNRDPVELKNLALDAYWAARAAHPPKSAEPARYSSPDPRSCGWKCDVKEPHLLMRRGRDMAEVMREYGFTINKTRH